MATTTILPTTLHQSKRSAFRMQAPMLFSAFCFVPGILLAHVHWFLPGLLLVSLALAFAIAAMALPASKLAAWTAAGLVYLLLGIFCAEALSSVRTQASTQHTDGTPRFVTGTIVRTGAVRQVSSSSPFSRETREEQREQMDLQLDGQPFTARISLYAPFAASFPAIHCGDRVRALIAFHEEARYLDPGVWDAAKYLRAQGIDAMASVTLAKFSLAGRGRATWICRLHSWQTAASAKLMDLAAQPARLPQFFRLSEDDAAMLTAMLTGDRTYLQRRVRTAFERTGSFHLLVVSGLHLAIVSGLLFWMGKRLRWPRTLTTAFTIAGSFAYALFTGFGNPVERSFWMVSLYLIGRLLWRERVALNTIGLVVLGMLAAQPAALFDSGFQMTALTVLAVAGIAVPVAERSFGPYARAIRHLSVLRIDPALPPHLAQFRVQVRMLAWHLRPVTGSFFAWRVIPGTMRLFFRIAEALAVSCAIESLMVVPMALYFHRITLTALPVNLILVPFLGLLLPSAIVTFLATLAYAPLAFVPAAITAAILHTVSYAVTGFAHLRFSDVRVPGPSAPAICIWITLAGLAMVALRRRRHALPAGCALLAGAVICVLLPRPILRHPGTLEVSAIDVGQGDALLIITPDGKTLLIDAGGLVGESPDAHFDMGEDVVSPVLWSRGIRRLDAIALTHGHEDHIGGMHAVIANFHPRELWLGTHPDAPVIERLLGEAHDAGTRIVARTAGDSFSFGDISIRVLAPAKDYRPAEAPTNNDSLVLRIAYGKTSALLTGDAEASSEASMLTGGNLHADLLKIGHHGSKTSTTPAFLAAVSPSYAVISVGRRNFYGHPGHKTLEKLEDAKVLTYRTDLLGMSSFYLDGKTVTATPWAAEP